MRARGFIKEIVEIEGVGSEFIDEKYGHLFLKVSGTNTQKFSNGKAYTFKMVTVDGDQYYGLLDDNTLVAILIVEFERIQKPEGVYMEVDKSHQRLGLMRFLFNRALDVNGEIYSDTHQTRNARHFWEMLLIYPEPQYTIYIYDTETGDKRKIDHPVGKIGPISKDIWNQQENPILVIVKNPTTVKESLFRKLGNEKRKQFGRDDWQLWYKKSTTIGYENP